MGTAIQKKPGEGWSLLNSEQQKNGYEVIVHMAVGANSESQTTGRQIGVLALESQPEGHGTGVILIILDGVEFVYYIFTNAGFAATTFGVVINSFKNGNLPEVWNIMIKQPGLIHHGRTFELPPFLVEPKEHPAEDGW